MLGFFSHSVAGHLSLHNAHKEVNHYRESLGFPACIHRDPFETVTMQISGSLTDVPLDCLLDIEVQASGRIYESSQRAVISSRGAFEDRV